MFVRTSACRLQGLAARADGQDTALVRTCTVRSWAGARLVPYLYPNKGYLAQSVTSDLQARGGGGGGAGRPAGAAGQRWRRATRHRRQGRAAPLAGGRCACAACTVVKAPVNLPP